MRDYKSLSEVEMFMFCRLNLRRIEKGKEPLSYEEFELILKELLEKSHIEKED